MAENLRVTHYRDGTPIPHLPYEEWIETKSGANCYYHNDWRHNDRYGALYNWYAVDDSRNIAPMEWHVSTDRWLFRKFRAGKSLRCIWE